MLALFGVADSRTPYAYHIESEHESLVGHISHDAEKGSKVVAETAEELASEHGHEETEKEIIYLKVLIEQTQKSLHPEKLTTENFDVSMVTHHDRKTTHDNTNTGSNTFNHVPTHTARMTGNDVLSSHVPGVHSLPNSQQMTSETKVITSHAQPTSPTGGISSATNTHSGLPHQVHLTTANTGVQHNQHQLRNLIPHGHNIHITHLVHEPVHPAVNKRSVDLPDSRKTFREKRTLRRRNRRNFAVPPEHFQPRAAVVRATAQKPVFVVTDIKTDSETHAFYVDPVNYYLRVNDTSHFGEEHKIQIFVVMENEEGEAVSNPLPFVIYIDQPEESNSSYPAMPAVFAGVLVLCVVFLAILIPLVTRAKRRYKQGKPMFKLGSHPSRADLEKAELENQSNMTRNASEPNWYGNNIFYNYEDEVAKERSDFTKGLRQYSTKSEPPTLQLHKKKKKGPLSDSSSSSGIDSASQGANGFDGDDSYSQRL